MDVNEVAYAIVLGRAAMSVSCGEAYLSLALSTHHPRS